MAKIGFAKLKGELAHKKGVKNAGALAAYIGRKKYGKEGMAKKAAAGRKKKFHKGNFEKARKSHFKLNK